ncbi:hypothetical protein Gohar_001491 [Gossypium harknessii]|uniref:Reverse transcriptase domain-containing protein n=1 Tax=Gossypium harknessii TaxID=34285 RepID=A0A7J9I5L6_9ROSI|nr:hypothetical protein [Gossypium harknessii]
MAIKIDLEKAYDWVHGISLMIHSMVQSW